MDTYWNHNTAYHNWLLANVKSRNTVLNVGYVQLADMTNN